MILASSRVKGYQFLTVFKVFDFYKAWYKQLLQKQQSNEKYFFNLKFSFSIQSKHMIQKFSDKRNLKRRVNNLVNRRRLFLPISAIFLTKRFRAKSIIFRRLFNYKFRKMIRLFRPARIFKRRGRGRSYFKPFLYKVYKYLVCRGQLFGTLLLTMAFSRVIQSFRVPFNDILLLRRGKRELFSGRRQLFKIFCKSPYTYNHLRLFTYFFLLRRITVFSNLQRINLKTKSKTKFLLDSSTKMNLPVVNILDIPDFATVSYDLIDRLQYGLYSDVISRQSMLIENFLVGVLGKSNSFRFFSSTRSKLFNIFFLVRPNFFMNQMRSFILFCTKIGYLNPKCLYISGLFTFRSLLLSTNRAGFGFVFSKWQKGTFTNRYFSFFWINFVVTKYSFASSLFLDNLLPFYSTKMDTTSLRCIARNLVYFSPLALFIDSYPDFLIFSNIVENMGAYTESLINNFSFICFNFFSMFSNSLLTIIGNSSWPVFQIFYIFLSLLGFQLGREEFKNVIIYWVFFKYFNRTAFLFKCFRRTEFFFARIYTGFLNFFSKYFFKFIFLKSKDFRKAQWVRLFFLIYWNFSSIQVVSFGPISLFKDFFLLFFNDYIQFFKKGKKFFFPVKIFDSALINNSKQNMVFNFALQWSCVLSSFYKLKIKGENFCNLGVKRHDLMLFYWRFLLNYLFLMDIDRNFVSKVKICLSLFLFFFQIQGIFIIKRFITIFPLLFDFTDFLSDDIGTLLDRRKRSLYRTSDPLPKSLHFFKKKINVKVWENFHFKQTYYFRSKKIKFFSKRRNKPARISSLVVSMSPSL